LQELVESANQAQKEFDELMKDVESDEEDEDPEDK
jgi:hypothetical protein